MRVLQTEFFGDNNVGLFSKACDKVCLIGNSLSQIKAQKIHSAVGGEMLRTNIANTEIVGMFCAMNSNGILIPKIVSDDEIKIFKSFAEENGMTIGMLGTRFTCIGNLILCNDKGAAISRLLSSKDRETIEDCLGVESDRATVAGMDNIGSCGIANNKGCVLHRDASEEELDKIQELLHVDTDVGTGNFGSPFLGSCGIASSKGIVVGESTTGPEVTRMMETLGLL